MTRTAFQNANPKAPAEELERWWEELGEEGAYTAAARNAGILGERDSLRGKCSQKTARALIVACFPDDGPLPPAVEAWVRAARGGGDVALFAAETRFRRYLEEKGVTEEARKKYVQKLRLGEKAAAAPASLAREIRRAFPGEYPEASLLLLGGARLQRLADWWDSEERGVDAVYMDALLAWKGCSRAPRERRQTAEPPLLWFYRQFSAALEEMKTPEEGRGLDQQAVSNDLASDVAERFYSLLGFTPKEMYAPRSIVSEEDGTLISPAGLSRTALSRLQEEALRRISPSSVEDSMEEEAEMAALKLTCRRLLHDLMDGEGPLSMDALIASDEARPVPWEESLLSVPEELLAARDHKERSCAVSRLLKGVMGPPPEESLRADARGVLRDRRFLGGELLQDWLHWAPPQPETLLLLAPGVLAYLERAEEDGHEGKPLAARFFRAALVRAARPGGQAPDQAWDRSERCMDLAVYMLERFPRLLAQELPEVSARYYEPVPAMYVFGAPEESILRAGLLLQRAELGLACPPPSDPAGFWKKRLREVDALPLLEDALDKERMAPLLKDLSRSQLVRIRLCRAQSDVHTALDILERRYAEQYPVRNDLMRCHLLNGEIIRRFAGAETEEYLLGDVVGMYVRPCRLALDRAMLFSDTPEEAQTVEGIRKSCADFFFSEGAPFPRRLRCRDREEQLAWEQERECWLPGRTAAKAPAVRPLRVAPPSADDLRPVFSGAFDSKFAGEERNQSSVELAVLQNILSGRVVVLQANQLADNRAILRLIRTQPGFCLLCRSNLVTLSMFGEQLQPSAYLRSKLEEDDDGFHFSCEPVLALPEARKAVVRYLDGEASAFQGFEPADRKKLLDVAVSFKEMDEIFQVSDNRRMHQNPDIRYPKWKYERKALSLSDQLLDRLERLLREAGQPGSRKSGEVIERMLEYAREWSGFSNRTQYDQRIGRLLPAAGASERAALQKLERVVTDAYILSNGARSLSTGDIILSPRGEIDEDIILREAGEAADGSGAGRADFLLHQVRSRTARGLVTWRDAAELGAIVREIDRLDRTLSEDRQAAVREYYTGLGYTCFQGREYIATELSAETTQGSYALRPCDRAQAAAPDGVVEINEHHAME